MDCRVQIPGDKVCATLPGHCTADAVDKSYSFPGLLETAHVAESRQVILQHTQSGGWPERC